MNYRNHFTNRAIKAIEFAQYAAQDLEQAYIGTEHILLGLLMTDSSVAQSVLNDNDIEAEAVRDKLLEVHGQGIKCTVNPNDLTVRGKRTLQNAKMISMRMGHNYVGTEHILLALISDSDSYAVRFIQELGGDVQDILNDLTQALGGGNQEEYDDGGDGGQPQFGGFFAIGGQKNSAG